MKRVVGMYLGFGRKEKGLPCLGAVDGVDPEGFETVAEEGEVVLESVDQGGEEVVRPYHSER